MVEILVLAAVVYVVGGSVFRRVFADKYWSVGDHVFAFVLWPLLLTAMLIVFFGKFFFDLMDKLFEEREKKWKGKQ